MGAAASDALVTGHGFPEGPVDVHWDTLDTPALKTAEGPDFSTAIRVPNATPGVHYLVAVSRSSNGTVAYRSAVPFEVTRPSLSLQPASGPAGTATTTVGKSFGSGPVELRWDTPAGALLQTAPGPSFSISVATPESSVGDHNIVALSRDSKGKQAGLASARFQVTAPPEAPGGTVPAGDFVPVFKPAPASSAPPPPDTAGPVNRATELTRQNGIRTVSPKGEVRLFCGRFSEAGVTGSCGATSVGPLTQAVSSKRGKPARAISLRLVAKRFRAEPGRPVLLRFVLAKPSMKALKATKKVRMRGNVRARDASGNLTRTSFGLTLKAPTPPRR